MDKIINKKQGIIYALVDPRTDRIRYIGKTENFEERMKAHLFESANEGKHLWVKGLLAEGLKPAVKILEIIDIDDRSFNHFHRERDYIRHAISNGHELFNEPSDYKENDNFLLYILNGKVSCNNYISAQQAEMMGNFFLEIEESKRRLNNLTGLGYTKTAEGWVKA